MEDDGAPPISVVFVHGTWAKGSTWPLLEAEIRRAFGAEHVAIQYLSWSGRNTVSARLSAAAHLAQVLEDDYRHRPSHRRFVVGHSHGGTVALLGTKDAATRAALAGIICLSTPFLLVRARQFSDLGYAIAILGLVLPAAAATLWTAFILQSILPLFAGLALGWAVRSLFKHGEFRVQSFMNLVSPPNVTNMPVLVIRTPDDEASLSLGLMQGMNRLVWLAWRLIGLHWIALLWSAAIGLADRLRVRRLLEVVAELWIVVLIGSVFANNLLRDLNVPQYAMVTLWIPVVVIASTILSAALLVVPVGVINALALLPFGPGFSLFSPFLEVSAESTPPGVCTVVQVAWDARPAIVESGERYPLSGTGWMHRAARSGLDLWSQIRSATIRLQHSQTYNDPEAIPTLVKWMHDRVAQRLSD